MRAEDRPFSASKLFHAYGLGNALVFPFWFGAATVLARERPTAEGTFQVIADARPTLFFGVPTLYAAMLAIADAERRFAHDSLRLCVSAGEPLPAELYRRWHARFGIEILDGIGSTEVLHIYISARAGRVVPGSSGRPVPGYDVRIVDERGEPAPAGAVGDLLVRGPSTALLYWNRPDQTRQKMRGEWFASGDKYRCDETGDYWYAGRSDDMFKVGGEWVSPIEIESALVAHDAVLECAVAPVETADGVLEPRAFVVVQPSTAASPGLADDLVEFVRSRLASYKAPRAIVFLDELPKTAAGKIQRFKLRQFGG
jgi:benzoate-CoA ligase